MKSTYPGCLWALGAVHPGEAGSSQGPAYKEKDYVTNGSELCYSLYIFINFFDPCENAFHIVKQSNSACQSRAHRWSPLQLKSGKFGFMSDGKAFTICFLRYSKADMSTNTPEALKMAFGDILDEMMGTLSVWNEED